MHIHILQYSLETLHNGGILVLSTVKGAKTKKARQDPQRYISKLSTPNPTYKPAF
jgi:hypothetical protein